ncbi:hypothetical protein EHEL_101170 [Encephalitozoon hellem ATCC 50504]|uniref:RhoGEF domain-containing protein n=1 Tax=Encephalitozoon hellem TaxID=27973 RepID=A0A9Q9C9Y0_ENCHE|nr:uncharacterized protein EHEL_101170 [Encephalitozoon hellem ATCC 50504]AFM99209.1 hypothetical protein EHEL_101170 [Encephalitozoon hellem ATCC 50504]UTX44195.1 hypothetical protein GPU96_10g19870 [Encephalitozoon hellem]|eukprot:XP_003888190.1 hypothetical protein EHEL_101170 [Encephalitozoon hellem ATCC 50504]
MFANDSCLEDEPWNAAIGTFDRHYKLSRNFVAELVHLGPILVSVVVGKDVSRALVRSILGFKEYRFYNNHINGCPYFFSVRNGLSRYFVDSIDSWRHVEATGTRKSSFMGMLNSLFSLGSWPLKNESSGSRRNMYDTISSGMMRCPEMFSVEEIMGRMAEVRPEHAWEVDNEFYRQPVYVDLVVESNKRIPGGILGRRQISPEDSLDVSSDELEDVRTAANPEEKRLRHALLGFVFNEIEYFCQMNAFYLDVVTKTLCENTVLEDVFRGFLKVYDFEIGFINSMRDIVEEAGFAMDRVLSDPQYFASEMNGKGFRDVGMNDEEIVERVLQFFENSLDGFRCYEDMMLSYEESIEFLKKAKERSGVPGHRIVDDCFCNCLQRIVRYPILIEDILRNLTDDLHMKRARRVYLRMVKLINIIDKKKERHDNIFYGLLVKKRVEGIPEEIAKGNTDFLSQLSCEDSSGDPVALFLFREMIIIADREGSSVSIQDPSTGRYFFRHALMLKDIGLCAFGISGIKITTKGSLGGREDLYEMTEVYDDVCVGAMYFAKGSPHSVRCFVEEYHKAEIESEAGLYISSTNVFSRVFRSGDAGKGSLRRRDLVVYTNREEFNSSQISDSGYLDIENGVFEIRGLDGTEQCINYRERELKHQLADAVGEIVRTRRAYAASKDTPWRSPQLFAMYRIKLREVVEECGDSSVIEFNGRLSRCDSATVTKKIYVMKGIVGYLSRSLSYVGCNKFSKEQLPLDGDNGCRLEENEIIGFLEKALDTEELEDRAFTDYTAEDILYLLMYFVRTNMYTFFRIEDIEILHRALFVDKVCLLGTVVLQTSNPLLATSFFEVIIRAKDKLSIIPVLKMFMAMFGPFKVDRSEMIEMVARIRW